MQASLFKNPAPASAGLLPGIAVDFGPDYKGRRFGAPFKVYKGDVDPGWFVYGTCRDVSANVIRRVAWPDGPERKWPRRSRLVQPGFRTRAEAQAVADELALYFIGPMTVDESGVVTQNPRARRPARGRSKGPLSRPSQVTGEAPSSRLVKRRKATRKAPPGFFANPFSGFVSNRQAARDSIAPDTVRAWADHFLVQQKPPTQNYWELAFGRAVFLTVADAKSAAQTLARAYPDFHVRVIRKAVKS